MLLSVNNGYFYKKDSGRMRTLEETLKLIKDFGFDATDIGLGGTNPERNIIYRENFLDEAKKVREYADSIVFSLTSPMQDLISQELLSKNTNRIC